MGDHNNPHDAVLTLVLEPGEARDVADLLRPVVIADHVTDLEPQAQGLATVSVRTPAGAAVNGTTLRTAIGRCGTGITVVAIVRQGVVIAARDSGVVLHTCDLVMVAGDGAPVRAAATVLATRPATSGTGSPPWRQTRLRRTCRGTSCSGSPFLRSLATGTYTVVTALSDGPLHTKAYWAVLRRRFLAGRLPQKVSGWWPGIRS